MSSQEKRLTKRIWVGSEAGGGQIRVRLQGEDSEKQAVEIVDISIGGAHLQFSQPDLQPDWLQQISLQLQDGQWFPTQIIPVHILQHDNKWHAGVQFYNLSEELLRQLCYFFIRSQAQVTPHTLLFGHRIFGEMRKPKAIYKYLQRSANMEESYHIFSDQAGSSCGTFRLFQVEEDLGLLRGSYDTPTPELLKQGRSYTLAISTSNTLYYFTTTLEEFVSHGLVFSSPQMIVRGGMRDTARVPVSGNQELLVEFIHPYIRGKSLHKQIRELSIRGLSFDIDIDNDLVAPGMLIGSALIRFPRRQPIHCSMIIRNVYQTHADTGYYRCGVELLDFHGTTRRHWLDSVLALLTPAVHEAKSWSLDEIWDLYDRAGYLDEKSEDVMQPQKQMYQERWRQLTRSRGNSKVFVFREEDRAIATISLSRIYSQTWLAHQLAATLDEYSHPTRKLEVLYQLIPQSMMHWTVGFEDNVSLLCTFNSNTPMSQWIWHGFAQQYCLGDKSQMQDLKFYDFDLRKLTHTLPPLPSTMVLSAPTPEELQMISQDLWKRDGPLAHQFFDYQPDRLDLSFWDTDPDCHTIGHRRQIEVVRLHDKVLAYSIVESANPGVNIFSLYNTFRIILLEETPQVELARELLFASAVEIYRQRNVDSPIQVVGENDAAPPPQHQVEPIEILRLLITSQHFPLLISYLADCWRR